MDVVDTSLLSDKYRNFSATPQKLGEACNFTDCRTEVEKSNEPLTFLFSCFVVELWSLQFVATTERRLNCPDVPKVREEGGITPRGAGSDDPNDPTD